ncbi:uncharacterized protein MAM_04856 [Metarhizium album ARSEF 1941]|uniref:Fungal specific transcription factor n=1 Tax=Metarhizium album (strain ARSEF 1941) TaxID=1081103 RepID=A0A0B2WUJ3_METAS|nr:uncharacterized protein MAM_04856 [Metarhizium album ARSEF 1941]KHN97259.1 hypothetical protein MAM_04856 [Metarhizium album ARSEF 1941]
MERGLQTSVWAPVSPAPRTHDADRHDARARSLPPPAASGFAASSTTSLSSSAAARAGSLSRLAAFHRFQQACRRVRWKSIDLGNAYRRAMDPEGYDFTFADAVANFKVDFCEFYAWVEKALVFALLVFGVSVDKARPGRAGARSAGTEPAHAYHYWVLKALEEEDTPLRGIFGGGDVCEALWKAKKLRNTWKVASEGKETPSSGAIPLDWIVSQMLEGLERAYAVAKEEVDGDLERAGDVGMAVDDEWAWMVVDSMDWERC